MQGIGKEGTMLIRDLLKERQITVSCELFPPKQDGDLPRAEEVVRQTAALRPDFISITYGASGGTSKNTLRMAECIEANGGNALAHLTCVSSTKEEVRSLIDRLAQRNIRNILALRGDIPEDAAFPAPQQYAYASELVGEIKAYGGFCVGAACYPEGHVQSPNQAEDIRHLKEKVDAGCDFLTTQMFFDNNVLYRFLYRIRDIGITVPVLAGIMPVTNKKQITRIVKLSGTTLPPRFLNILDKFGDDPEAMRQAGVAYATEQIIDLIANGVRGIHIYTMNRPEIAAGIMENISHIIKAG